MPDLLAVFDSVTAETWSASSGTHYDLVLVAEAALGLEHIPGNDRLVCGYLEDGQFVTGLRRLDFSS